MTLVLRTILVFLPVQRTCFFKCNIFGKSKWFWDI